MIAVNETPLFYRCSQCRYEAKTKEEIEKLENYKIGREQNQS